jgi:hypothetical protein
MRTPLDFEVPRKPGWRRIVCFARDGCLTRIATIVAAEAALPAAGRTRPMTSGAPS